MEWHFHQLKIGVNPFNFAVVLVLIETARQPAELGDKVFHSSPWASGMMLGRLVNVLLFSSSERQLTLLPASKRHIVVRQT